MLRENGKRISEESTHYYIDNHFFLIFFELVILSTYVHILKSFFLLLST